MNNILKSVSNLKEVYRRAGLEFSFDSEKMIKEDVAWTCRFNSLDTMLTLKKHYQ